MTAEKASINPAAPDVFSQWKFYAKVLAVVATVILVIMVNNELPAPQTDAQLRYEKFLKDTELKSQVSLNNEDIPDLALTIIPANADLPSKEEVLTTNNISHGRDRIMRLLQLIKEAGLYDYQTETLSPRPGDIILKVMSADKSFTLKFRPKDIENNIKASLMLKLFDEYSKDRIPENLASNKQAEEFAFIREHVGRVFERLELEK